MPGRDDCPGCPFRNDPDTLCWCAANGFVGICQGLNGERNPDDVPGFRRIVIERTTGVPAPDEMVARTTPVTFSELTPQQQDARARVYRSRFLQAVVDRCPARGEKINQGCFCTYVCRKGYGWFESGQVTIEACMACVQGNTPRVTEA